MLRVHCFSISVDGFGAGPRQTLEAPLGEGAEKLHEWIFGTRAGREMVGQTGGSEAVDHQYMLHSTQNLGAWIIGRNMFGPVRGPWPDDSWRGWWGDEPPYHTDVFVLTHHRRAPLVMGGGTTFHFVQGSPRQVLDRATEAAAGRDVRLGGGVATLRAFLHEGLVDHLHLAVTPTLLGEGERLWEGNVPEVARRYRVTKLEQGESALHVTITR